MASYHFTAAPEAADALAEMRARHADVGAEAADIIIALGGDGFMLQTLHAFLKLGKPIYGMNLGSVGFLMNEYRADDLPARLAAAEAARIHPLRMQAHSPLGVTEVLAFNEVSLLRQARDAGINEFLAKPVSVKAVMTRLTSVIENPRPYVRTKLYFGPCRRRRAGEYQGPERRSDTAKQAAE